jgi:hypothetical protein
LFDSVERGRQTLGFLRNEKNKRRRKMLTEKFHTQRTDRKTLGELGLFYVYYLCRCNGFPVVARLACWNIYLSLLLLYARSCKRRRVCVLSFVLKYLDPLRVHTPIDAARQHLFDVLQPLQMSVGNRVNTRS